jgi:hypothetical protein
MSENLQLVIVGIVIAAAIIIPIVRARRRGKSGCTGCPNCSSGRPCRKD